MEYDVLGIGSPMLDLLIHVSHDFLSILPVEKGGMQLVDYDLMLKILELNRQEPTIITGGSAANTVKGLGHMGKAAAFFGKIGDDEAGILFANGMRAANVKPILVKTTTRTGQVLCVISPDKERTLCAFHGSGGTLKADDIPSELFKKSRIVHIEGYALLLKDFLRPVMSMAKNAGALLSFDLANFEVVEKYKNEILELVSHYIDILFSNEREAYLLTGLEPKEGCASLAKLCGTAVVTMGKKGCWAANQNEIIFHPAYTVETADTTGAGDLFASGFLCGYLDHRPLTDCARIGARVASEVVQVIGTNLSMEVWKTLTKELKPVH